MIMMSNFSLTLDPVDHITVDAIGKPGNRVFYIQGTKGDEKITLIIEKIQLQSLIAASEQFFTEISQSYDGISKPDPDITESEMEIHPPVDPKFRVGEIGLAYDNARDLVCIITKEWAALDSEQAERGTVNYWCTRKQLAALIKWGVIVVERGRPICPQCLQPMEPEGHFCPKKNGHKKAKKL